MHKDKWSLVWSKQRPTELPSEPCHAPGTGHTSSQVLTTTLQDKLCSSSLERDRRKTQRDWLAQEDTARDLVLGGLRHHYLKNNWQRSLNKKRPEVHTPKGKKNKNSDRVSVV